MNFVIEVDAKSSLDVICKEEIYPTISEAVKKINVKHIMVILISTISLHIFSVAEINVFVMNF